MAWIQLDQTVWTHRKTFDLADRLDLDETYAAAHVARLWCWALDNARIDATARRGYVTGMSARAIAGGAGWKGDPAGFVAALIDCGFIDREGDELALHDWWEYAGKFLERRAKDRERKRPSVGIPTEVPWTSGIYPPDIQAASARKTQTQIKTNQDVVNAPLTPHADPAPELPAAPARERPPADLRKPKERDKSWVETHPFFEPLEALFGRPAGNQWGALAADIKALEEHGATADEIYRRAENYTGVMGADASGKPITRTRPALVKHWHLCATVPARASPNGHKPSKLEIIRAGLGMAPGGLADDGNGFDPGDGGPVYDVAASGHRPRDRGGADRALPRGAG
jgi:hypothetical protein